MFEHEHKADPRTYLRLKTGSKTFDVRPVNEQVQSGDLMIYKEFDNDKVNPTDDTPKGFTDSPPLTFKVGFVENAGSILIVSLIPLKTKASKK